MKSMLVLISFCIIISSLLIAQTYDLTAQFSIHNGNPNGVWSYGWMEVGFGSLQLYHLSGVIADNHHQWHSGLTGDCTPCVWKNANSYISDSTPSGGVSLHPGSGTQPSVVRWTAPKSGRVDVYAQFLDGAKGKMHLAVRQNGNEIWRAMDSGNYNGLNISITSGDRFDFIVYGGYSHGNTPLSVSITYR